MQVAAEKAAKQAAAEQAAQEAAEKQRREAEQKQQQQVKLPKCPGKMLHCVKGKMGNGCSDSQADEQHAGEASGKQ